MSNDGAASAAVTPPPTVMVAPLLTTTPLPPVFGCVIKSQAVPKARLDAASSLAQALIVYAPTLLPQYLLRWDRHQRLQCLGNQLQLGHTLRLPALDLAWASRLNQ